MIKRFDGDHTEYQPFKKRFKKLVDQMGVNERDRAKLLSRAIHDDVHDQGRHQGRHDGL